MKKLIFLLITMFLFSGCGSESEFEKIIRENNYGYGWGESNQEGLKCDELKDATVFEGHYFITSKGDIYQFNSSKLFSNDKNCIKTDYNSGESSFSYRNAIYNKDKELVYVSNYNDNQLTFMSPSEYKEKNGYDYYPSIDIKSLKFDFFTYRSDIKDEVIIINHHKVFYVDEENKNFLIGSIPTDETIIYLSGGVIKTNKAYYTLTQTNLEKCNTYVDIKCKTEFVKSSLSDAYDKIIFVGQNILIDKDYHSYGRGIRFSIVP